MKNLVIFGTGPYGDLSHFYFKRDSGYSVVAFTVDSAYLREPTFSGLPAVAFEEVAREFPPSDCDMFVAMGIQKVNQQRASKVGEAEAKGYRLASFLSSKAHVSCEIALKPNSFVMEGAFVQPFVEIGKNSVIMGSATLGFRSRIGDHCWLSAPSLGESVVVGDYSFIGINATILPSRVIGARNVIGAGAMIHKDTKDGEVYQGAASVPSRVPSHRLRHI
jgi:sugar O-acyltransferase (sialic acid O-acetyltransferase NeuD family)